MERDPDDNKITFVDIDTNGFQINSLKDVKEFWVELHRVGVLCCEEAGYIVYPVVIL